MVVDYIIDQPCKVKETLSLDGMITMIKQRGRALTMIEVNKKEGKSDEQALNATFTMRRMYADGVKEEELKVSDLLNATARLDELQAHCKDCTASSGKPFGCYRSIKYPISRKAEEWLADVARKAAESKGPGMLPLQFIVEKKVDGGNITKMRADPNGTFLELKRPLEIPVVIGTGLFGRKTVNTDQVLNQVIGLNRMHRPHMQMLLLFSGGLSITKVEPPIDSYQQGFRTRGSDGQDTWWTFTILDELGDDESTRQLKTYFKVMFMAFALGRDLIVGI